MMNEGEEFCGWGWCPVGYPYVISECSRFGGVVLLLVGCFELGGGFEPGSVIGLGFALERACGVWRVDRRLLCLPAASDKNQTCSFIEPAVLACLLSRGRSPPLTTNKRESWLYV